MDFFAELCGNNHRRDSELSPLYKIIEYEDWRI